MCMLSPVVVHSPLPLGNCGKSCHTSVKKFRTKLNSNTLSLKKEHFPLDITDLEIIIDNKQIIENSLQLHNKCLWCHHCTQDYLLLLSCAKITYSLRKFLYHSFFCYLVFYSHSFYKHKSFQCFFFRQLAMHRNNHRKQVMSPGHHP